MPCLLGTKHIKHKAICASVTARFFVVSNIFHQPFGIAPEGLFFLPSGRLVRRLFSFHFPVAGWLREFNKNPKKGATYGQRKYESRHRRKRRFGRLWIYCASRLADSEVGRVRRMRRVGRWFLEIGFESFAQDLATPSARSFAQESESQNAMQPARSFAQDLASREGQRPRCPCGGESGSGDAAPPGGLCRKQSAKHFTNNQPKPTTRKETNHGHKETGKDTEHNEG